MAGVDEIDLRLVEFLRQDGRRSYADMAAEVGLSLPAVKRRVDRLQATGVITGFTAKIDYTKLGWNIEAFTELRYTGRTRPPDMERLARDLPEVQAVYPVAGDPDALCHIRARDVTHLREVIDAIRVSGGVVGTKTFITLGSATGPA
ncbi:Lrp/AsnC family transcriptional regulator [Amycolatopsis sp. FDAARGOS 1241]|uniref:Lrp/AsnC family transcriptional regulator n=1 Tax=unclassified Amycolatopsis TaxID=2618356 RepID=UPI00194F80B3|nr:Lrp/AsnC family transcriptional regulator [Amycolatopsis sp. FDAARGOS 1241]QRP48828.1 Lrp/AsnC family transcriptional regulator [Amycolatopsis sp. FDAARGOS 1241]